MMTPNNANPYAFGQPTPPAQPRPFARPVMPAHSPQTTQPNPVQYYTFSAPTSSATKSTDCYAGVIETSATQIQEAKVKVAAQENAVLSVDRWWEQIFAVKKNHSEKWIDYMTEKLTTWSNDPYKHIFVLPDGSLSEAITDLENNEEAQNEVIIAVAERLREKASKVPADQPVIHFEGNEIHISELPRYHLNGLWKSPPVFRGKPMKLVSKGLWFQEPHVSEFKGGPGMRKEAFVKTFESQYDKHRPTVVEEGKYQGKGLYAAFARFYQVLGVPGEPVFAGQVVMFSDEIDFSEEDKPFFIQQRERKRQRAEGGEQASLSDTQAVETFTSDLQEPANKAARVVANAADT